MTRIISQLFAVGMVVGLILTIVACSAADTTDEDIPPVASIEAEAVQEAATPAPTAVEPAAEIRSTAVVTPPTGLRTEIVESISPISPIIPVETPMKPASRAIASPAPGGEAALAAAIAELTKQTGLPADQITLVSMEAVDWSDTSLGCPKEGFMYAQVITPGYKVVLAAQGQEYEYHTSQDGANVVLCQQ